MYDSQENKTPRPNFFLFASNDLESVNSCQYLGLKIEAMGGISATVTERIEKSRRLANMCLQAISTTGTVNAKVALKLFDTQILPILTYGCPVWGHQK